MYPTTPTIPTSRLVLILRYVPFNAHRAPHVYPNRPIYPFPTTTDPIYLVTMSTEDNLHNSYSQTGRLTINSSQQPRSICNAPAVTRSDDYEGSLLYLFDGPRSTRAVKVLLTDGMFLSVVEQTLPHLPPGARDYLSSLLSADTKQQAEQQAERPIHSRPQPADT